MSDRDAEDDALLTMWLAELDEVGNGPEANVFDGLGGVLRHAFRAQRADGSWPPPELIQEIVGACLAIITERPGSITERPGSATDPTGPAAAPGDASSSRWIDALRQCADDLPTLERLLAELHEEDDASVTPRLYLRDDLALLGDPVVLGERDPAEGSGSPET